MEEDFFTETPILKNCPLERNQVAAHAQKRVTVPLNDSWIYKDLYIIPLKRDWQDLFFSDISFQFSAAFAVAPFEIYGWKFTGPSCLKLG